MGADDALDWILDAWRQNERWAAITARGNNSAIRSLLRLARQLRNSDAGGCEPRSDPL